MKCTSFENVLEGQYIVYADTECSPIPTNDANTVAKHVVNSACFYLVCAHDHTKNSRWSHVGEDSVREMILELSALADDCVEQLKENQEMVMTEDDQADLDNATCCHICPTPFNENSKFVRSWMVSRGVSRQV